MNTTTSEYYDHIDDVINKHNINTYWRIKLNKVKKYIHEHKKLPNHSTKNVKINNLYKWIKQQEKKYNDKYYIVENKEFYEAWSQFLEENKKYFPSKFDNWFINFDSLKQYIIKNNKLPQYNDIKVKKLYKWIQYQQYKYKNKILNMKNKTIYNTWNQFIHEYSDYFKTNKDIWKEHLDMLIQYINDFDDIPHYNSNNDNGKKLYIWMTNQKQIYKNNVNIMKDVEICNLWVKFIHEYSDYF